MRVPLFGSKSSAIHRALLDLLADNPRAAITLSDLAEHLEMPLAQIEMVYPSMAAVWLGVGEEGMTRLFHELVMAGGRATDKSPLCQIEAIALEFTRWSIENPLHFKVLSSRRLLPMAESEQVLRQIESMRLLLLRLLRRARAAGEIDPDLETDTLLLACRAQVYGLSRMAVDGHMHEWGMGGQDPQAICAQALRIFFDQIKRNGPAARAR